MTLALEPIQTIKQPKRTLVIDSQRLNAIQLCPRKYNFTFNRQLVPVQKADFLERGDLMHKMLSVYYNLRKYRARWLTNNKTHDDIMRACIKVGERHALKMQLSPDEIDETIFQFTKYAEYYENDGWDNIIAVEQTGSFILYEDDLLCIVYEVKPDLIISLDNGVLLPIDHKTSKRRETPSSLSNQFLGYCTALGVNNIMINKIGFQKTLKENERFQRFLLSYEPEVLEEWKYNTIFWAKEIIKREGLDYYEANFTSCDKWSECVFSRVCEKGPGINREIELQRWFEKDKRWDVGSKLGKGIA